MIFLLTLKEKKQITHDVYLLTFCSDTDIAMPKYGQFMTFLLHAWWRAYSIANSDGTHFEFLIKRLENGKGGSKEVCDISVWTQIRAVWPAGRFVLRETWNNRLFLWTGTGFAPLYFQLLGSYMLGLGWKNKFIFGVREPKDVFFIEEMNQLKVEKWNFDYEIYTSWDYDERYHHWRITDFITRENIADFTEFYICGNQAMVADAKEKLLYFGIAKEFIFTEQY